MTAKALSSDKLPATFEFTQWTQDPWGALDFKTNSDPFYEVEAILDSLTPTPSRRAENQTTPRLLDQHLEPGRPGGRSDALHLEP